MNIDSDDLLSYCAAFFTFSCGIIILIGAFCLLKFTFFDTDIGYKNNAHNVQVFRLQTEELK